MKRGHFQKEVIKTLMVRSGGRCANPRCGRATLGPSRVHSEKRQVLGAAAHICAASPNGPRFDTSQSEEERHSVENGIWLCESCAALVDKNQGADFPVSTLRVWKKASERAALDRLYQLSDSVRDNCVQSLIFINIPRLHHLALTRQTDELPNFFDGGIPGDGFIAPELYALQSVIARMRFPALTWQEAAQEFDDLTGLIVSFEGRFWTKNGPRSRYDRRERDLTNLNTAPLIYTKHLGFKLTLPYDPRFVTTRTAGFELTRGQCNVGGFACVKFCKNNEIVASPFIIGLRSTPEARAFMDAMSTHQRTIEVG